MSEFREDLLVTAMNKKRLIKIILTGVILVLAFAFSTFFFSLLWDSQRPLPSDQLSEADEEEGIPTQVPFPYNMSELQDIFSNLDLTPDELTDLLDALSDMFDGDIDDLDLSDYGQALAALMFSEVEVFRIYDYDNYNEILTKFWKYESFDEYTGDGWHSSAATTPYSYYTYINYSSYHWDKDLLSLKIPLTPSTGVNSMVIPNLFPIPFIMENSVQANNMQGTPSLFKDEFNCTTLDIDFSMEEDVNMTYEMFGLDLPTSFEIDAVAVEPLYTPVPLKSKYLQLKGDSIDAYLNNSENDDFAYHYDQINAILLSSDNTFIVADKIRNYLQYNFMRITDPDQYNPAPDGKDQVEWFLEEGIGYWSDFTSAFCVFARAFGIASRFVDGFNSFLAEEQFDPIRGPNAVIKYKNMYNWAEIYVPTDVSGDGIWIQMDVYYENYGSVPPNITEYSLILNSNFTMGLRGQVANLTAVLTSNTIQSIANKEITFMDYTYGVDLGNATTDVNGTASILIDINSSQVVGPHLIVASYGFFARNYSLYSVLGPIEVNFTSVNPTEVNISKSPPYITNVQGYVYDPINGKRIKTAEVNFVLFEKSTNNDVPNAFNPMARNTTINGDFDGILRLTPFVSPDIYEIRIDFNGTWWISTPLGYFSVDIPIISDSSNRLEFNVTEELTYRLLFSINGTPTNYPSSPNPSNLINVKRGEQLNLSVTLIDENTMSPVTGEIVEFYDYTNGNMIIGSDITDSYGNASLLYNIGNTNKSGPSLVYAKFGGDINYSYYIVNESIVFNLIYGPSPREINRTGAVGTEFDILCRLIDTQGNPINFSQMNLRMFRVSPFSDQSDKLDPEYPWFFNGRGIFNINNMRVQSDTFATNYTLRLNFNGNFLFANDPNNPYKYNFFNLNDFTTSFVLPDQLKVIDPDNVNISLAIEGNPTRTYYDDSNKPARYNRTTTAHFQVQVFHVFDLDDNLVYLYDDFTNTLLDNYTFPGGTGPSGFVQFNITTALLHAGLHRIRVQYHTYSTVNFTYIIINETVDINVNQNNLKIVRGPPNSFIISGTVSESSENLRGLNVTILLLDKSYNDVSGYLNLAGTQSVIINNDGTYQFSINNIYQTCPQGEYYIRIDFNGSIRYPSFPLPAEVLLLDYMVNSSSPLIPINITAETNIIQVGYHTSPHDISGGRWWDGDTLFIYGNLTWDNTTIMAGMKVNITVQKLNGELIVFNEVVTDSWGGFNATFVIDEAWSDLNYVYETKIIVYFDPESNNLEYVEENELQFT